MNCDAVDTFNDRSIGLSDSNLASTVRANGPSRIGHIRIESSGSVTACNTVFGFIMVYG